MNVYIAHETGCHHLTKRHICQACTSLVLWCLQYKDAGGFCGRSNVYAFPSSQPLSSLASLDRVV
jgi:hypothetical protein